MGTTSTAASRVSLKKIQAARKSGQRIIFTNGCYDLIHAGHARFLKQAKTYGDFLVVGVNSDASVRRLKGAGRPILPLAERMLLLESLKPVDCAISFVEDTPYRLIQAVQPDVLIKGGDWSKGAIVGGDVVEARGGRVISGLFIKGRSTTNIVEKIRSGAKRR
jgi:D-beta-D-heptose 7-phosphate kinase/D-beta-D-heptose 1-phosphate adenosyltransferase